MKEMADPALGLVRDPNLPLGLLAQQIPNFTHESIIRRASAAECDFLNILSVSFALLEGA